MRNLVGVLCGMLLLPLPAAAGIAHFKLNCGPVCTIGDNPGGYVDEYTQAAREVHKKGLKVRIDGACSSSCALFADLARPNVCITKHAKFGFHQESEVGLYGDPVPLPPGPQIDRDPPFSADIAGWVKRRGGFPPMDQLLPMGVKQASKFWPACE